MEFVGGGDLGKYIDAKRAPLSEADTHMMAKQLVGALAYLHGEGMNITHRDIKPDNILIHSPSPELKVKLTDFGLAKMIGHEATFLTTFCGTLLYCAPEVYEAFKYYDAYGERRPTPQRPTRLNPRYDRRGDRYDHKVDIWSLGGVLWFSLTTQPPFPAGNGVRHDEFLHQIMTSVPKLELLINRSPPVSVECQDFLRKMLRQMPEQRASAEELLQDPWLLTFQDSGVDELSQLSLVDKEDAERDVAVPSDDGLRSQEPIVNEEHVGDLQYDKGNYGHRPATQTGRLFGEHGQSALGSQGAVVPGCLNLPATPTRTNVETPKLFSSKSEIPDSQANSDDEEEEETPRQNYLHIQGSQPILAGLRSSVSSDASRSVDAANNVVTWGGNSQSLEGAESGLDQLDMQSRRATTSSGTGSTRSKRKSSFATNTNSESSIENEPVSKKPRSSRKISSILNRDIKPIKNEVELLAQMPKINFSKDPEPQLKSHYWGRNYKTWHMNYPEMTFAQWIAFKKGADKRKEKFRPGESKLWALAEKYFPPMSKIKTDQPALWALAKEGGFVRETSPQGPIELSEGTHEADLRSSDQRQNTRYSGPIPKAFEQRTHGGYLHSSDESILPGVSIRLSESIVTWGRSSRNTEPYSDDSDIRIPEYALTIMLWRKGNFDPSQNLQPWIKCYDANMDLLHFYIATKAGKGIHVNDKRFAPSQAGDQKSNWNWVRLYNDDRIVVPSDSDDDDANNGKIEFIFTCNWGGSRISRPEHDKTPELVSAEEAKKMGEECVKAEKAYRSKQPELGHRMHAEDTKEVQLRMARIGWEVELSKNFHKQIEKAEKARAIKAQEDFSPSP